MCESHLSSIATSSHDGALPSNDVLRSDRAATGDSSRMRRHQGACAIHVAPNQRTGRARRASRRPLQLGACASFEDSSRARLTMPWSSIASADGLMALLGIQQHFDAISVILYYTRCPASSTGTDSVPCSMLHRVASRRRAQAWSTRGAVIC